MVNPFLCKNGSQSYPASADSVKQPDGTIKALSPRQVADLLGHFTSEITKLYYVRKGTARLAGITAGFEL